MDDQEYLREQIYNSLNLRETEELVDIWQTHDSEMWTDLAFEVVKNILQTRLGELPPQENTTQNELETSESDEAEEALPEDEPDAQLDKLLVCPYCRGGNVFRREIQLRNGTTTIVLKKPRTDLPGFDSQYDEIVGFACEDCGYVFFMLKNSIEAA